MRALALVLLALATVWPRWRTLRVVQAVAAVGLLLASVWAGTFEGRNLQWAVPVALAVIAAAWWGVPGMHRELPLGVAWLVLCGSAAAVYFCVPETDQMREVGVVMVAGFVAELVLRRRLPAPAVAAAVGLIAWSALFGASGRPSAVVGGLFALLPVVAVGAVTGKGRQASWRLLAVAAVWVVGAGLMARTGGIADSLTEAVVASAVAVAGAAVLSAALLGRRGARG